MRVNARELAEKDFADWWEEFRKNTTTPPEQHEEMKDSVKVLWMEGYGCGWSRRRKMLEGAQGCPTFSGGDSAADGGDSQGVERGGTTEAVDSR